MTAPSNSPTFHQQLALGDDPTTVTLVCPVKYCQVAYPRDFVESRLGERVGCRKCGVVARIPAVE